MKTWLKGGLIASIIGSIFIALSLISNVRYRLYNGNAYTVFILIFWRTIIGLIIFFVLGTIIGYAYQYKKPKLKTSFKWAIIPLVLAYISATIDTPGSPGLILWVGFFIILGIILGIIGWIKGKIPN